MITIRNHRPMIRDLQQSAVYAWEQRNIKPHDKSSVPFDQIQSIVNYVWQGEGLQYPPLVEPLPKQVKRHSADALRTVVRFGETTPTWIILHELSHSMTSLHDGYSNHHGALFLGVYIKLAAKYLRLDLETLFASAEAAGLEVSRTAIPCI